MLSFACLPLSLSRSAHTTTTTRARQQGLSMPRPHRAWYKRKGTQGYPPHSPQQRQHHQKGRHGCLLAAAGKSIKCGPRSQQQAQIQQQGAKNTQLAFLSFVDVSRPVPASKQNITATQSSPPSSFFFSGGFPNTLRTAAKKTTVQGFIAG